MNKIIISFQKILLSVLILIIMFVTYNSASARQSDMMVRIAEIEIDSNYLEEYQAILKEEAEASVRLEPGVICIFPMYHKDNPTQVRILEIYASRKAYEAHLKTPHFQKYKTTTLKMVKSLRLVEMDAMGKGAMSRIFKKMKKQTDEIRK